MFRFEKLREGNFLEYLKKILFRYKYNIVSSILLSILGNYVCFGKLFQISGLLFFLFLFLLFFSLKLSKVSSLLFSSLTVVAAGNLAEKRDFYYR